MEMLIEWKGNIFTGWVKLGAVEGVFTHPEWEYAGQIKDNKPHGKGVMKETRGLEYTGDWDMGQFTGYGEEVPAIGAVYRGQVENHHLHGYVEYDGHKGKFQGMQVRGSGWHGPNRHTAPDGSVKDIMWQDGYATKVPCNADEAVEKSEEGVSIPTWITYVVY